MSIGLTMVSDFAQRLKFFRSKLDLSQVELAKRIGISGKQISDYEVGASKPRQSTFFKILDALNLTQDQFDHADIYDGDSVGINIIGNTDIGSIAISTILLKKMNSVLSDLEVVSIDGDSMAPTLKPYDVVLIDKSKVEPLDNNLYMFELFDEKFIARLIKQANGDFILARDNKEYRDISINAPDLKIIGKVVYRQGLI